MGVWYVWYVWYVWCVVVCGVCSRWRVLYVLRVWCLVCGLHYLCNLYMSGVCDVFCLVGVHGPFGLRGLFWCPLVYLVCV